MRLHARTMPVQRASNAIRAELGRLQDEYDLTDVEMLRVLIEHQQSITKYMLRAERHPDDPDRKADKK
ncbi:hypothetical protein GCM10011608_10870 [Micromonospora sonchi]|uniref:Uncharacterized protein n=1 Tax=Micromonospora sonchi TaxID=1763543 RepID=A0A917TLE2_9ACTN|nr:hypothetical protein [Micromonospora sonchi]GGM27867.1 hypothetical protein GCM10011608_10870 [Micromonospora sonchi]